MPGKHPASIVPSARATAIRGLVLVAVLLLLGGSLVAARAAEAPPSPSPCTANCGEQTLPSDDIVPDRPASVPPNDPAVQAHLPGCAVWTDRCVTCQREAGKVSCSNIGIACQPQAVECVRPKPAEEKKPADEKK
jgi:hypothetical protein